MELRFAIRRMRQRGAATLVSIATLGIAIGAVTAAWSVLGAVFFHPLAIRQPASLQVIASTTAGSPADAAGFNYPQAVAIREAKIFQQSIAYGSMPQDIEVGGARRTVTIDAVSADFFEVLGVTPTLGRGFQPGEDRRGAMPVAVVSDRFWRDVLGADRFVLGRTLPIGSTSVTIVGVAPGAFRGMTIDEPAAIYVPLGAADQVLPRGNYFGDPVPGYSPSTWIHVAGRLASDSTPQVASSRLAAVSGRRANAPALELLPASVAAIPAESRPDIATFARLLAMTTGLLLMIGSLTVGTLLLVRTESRRSEFAVRLALGGTRARLALGVALEGLILAAAGCALSWPIAAFLLRAVQTFELPGHLAVSRLNLTVDASVFGTAVVAALLAATAIITLAALFILTASVGDVYHARAGATPRMTRRSARSVLVVAQVAAAMVLLVGAGLFARSLAAALTLNPTIDPGHTVTTSINLARRFWPQARSDAYFADLLERLRSVPSVAAIGSTRDGVKMGGLGTLTVDGQPIALGHVVEYLAVDPGYLPALGLRVTDGRNFSEHDDEHAPLVALVSASLAKRLADPHGRVLGRRFDEPRPNRADEIVGVVPDVVTTVNQTEPLIVYEPIAQQAHLPWRTFVIRSPNPAAAIRDAAAALHEFDSTLVPWTIQTIDQGLLAGMAPQQFGVTILGGLGAIAAVLTLLGAYVLAESMASGRRREMGIRAALGATRRQLGVIVLAETGRLAGVGLVVGLGAAWIGASTIRALLFRTAPLDPVTLSAVALIILILVFAVAWRPALRAARTDCVSALRED